MKAMVMAAGLGTRLRPLTDFLPKPMMPVANRPVLHHLLTSCAVTTSPRSGSTCTRIRR